MYIFTKLHDSVHEYGGSSNNIAKNNTTTTSASKTMSHFGDLMHKYIC